jgi:hypothetical protein
MHNTTRVVDISGNLPELMNYNRIFGVNLDIIFAQ